MHSYQWTGIETTGQNQYGPVEVNFNYNGDYSGEVIIAVSNSYAEMQVRHFSEGGEDHHIAEMKVPYKALEALVLGAIRERMIGRIETLSNDELREWLTK